MLIWMSDIYQVFVSKTLWINIGDQTWICKYNIIIKVQTEEAFYSSSVAAVPYPKKKKNISNKAC